jgi:hypothetical protein
VVWFSSLIATEVVGHSSVVIYDLATYTWPFVSLVPHWLDSVGSFFSEGLLTSRDRMRTPTSPRQ